MAHRIRDVVPRCMKCRVHFASEADRTTCVWCKQAVCWGCFNFYVDPYTCLPCSQAIATDDVPRPPKSPFRPADGPPLFPKE